MLFPKISIITPSFNQGQFIEQTILSILNQNYPNLEYIIIDGGSIDNSVDIIKKYASCLHYWISEPDRGMYDAIQKGFDRSTGVIMGWINSDDEFSIKSFFTAVQVFSDYPQIKWLNGIPNQMDEDGRIIGVGAVPMWNKYKYLKNDFKYIQQEGMFWRRNLWEKAGGYIDTKLELASDMELWSRFFQHEELYYINTILGTYRARTKNQKSLEQLDHYNAEALSVIKNMHRSKEEIENIKKMKSVLWRLTSKRSFRSMFKFLEYNKVEALVNKFPPTLYFDRNLNKFILP